MPLLYSPPQAGTDDKLGTQPTTSSSATIVIIVYMTDGLSALMGRCSLFWGKIAWVVPASLRMTRIYFEDKVSTARHNNIVSILLESAAINVPIAICAAVGNMVTTYGGESTLIWAIFYFIGIPSRALATIIVIHQVALGRAIGRRNRGEVAQLMETESKEFTTHMIPPPPSW
ncbi:hypothetical protein P691DRAFT_818487 [Macrolepiota fuliginosa MF-IS2]|uniref:Uncharacterized protein n=1 Tax=Macrolepiota fuliginosa MF-IS2 TaxID=1400762 RepID=A0A9P5XD84_9AGAR|nr:hypothetical protein P691DRAFT_818487 [Macrolepiota fuliginosa MF-IS2]